MKQRIKNVLKFKKPSRAMSIAAVALAVVLTAGCALNNASGGNGESGAAGSDHPRFGIPDITATETIDGAQAKALRFGYSWYDGKDGVTADAIAPWQGEYADENTLVIDGEMGQNLIALSAEKPASASYVIYLPDGTVYDDGTREPYDSLSPRLYWTEDKTGIGVMAPFVTGEYIYAITIGWAKNDLEVTYGIKVVMTGKRNAYDEALDTIWSQYKDALSISLQGRQTFPALPGAESAGECYVFDVALPGGTERVAVSKDKALFLIPR